MHSLLPILVQGLPVESSVNGAPLLTLRSLSEGSSGSI